MSNKNDAPSYAVFVTGAGSGIGAAVARRVAGRGHQVFGGVVNDREAASLAGSSSVIPVQIDVRDEESVVAAAAEVRAALAGRPLKAVLNIAGIITNGPLADLEAVAFTNVLAVNVVGVHNVTRAFLPLLIDAGGARIINMSSQSGVRTMPFTGAYSASKYGLEALSVAMRLEFAPLGIEVAVIAPGLTRTAMADKIQGDLGRTPSLDIYREPLRRFLTRTAAVAETGIPVEHVAMQIVDALESTRLKRRYEIHQNYARDALLMRALPTGWREAIVRRVLSLNG